MLWYFTNWHELGAVFILSFPVFIVLSIKRALLPPFVVGVLDFLLVGAGQIINRSYWPGILGAFLMMLPSLYLFEKSDSYRVSELSTMHLVVLAVYVLLALLTAKTAYDTAIVQKELKSINQFFKGRFDRKKMAKIMRLSKMKKAYRKDMLKMISRSSSQGTLASAAAAVDDHHTERAAIDHHQDFMEDMFRINEEAERLMQEQDRWMQESFNDMNKDHLR